MLITGSWAHLNTDRLYSSQITDNANPKNSNDGFSLKKIMKFHLNYRQLGTPKYKQILFPTNN